MCVCVCLSLRERKRKVHLYVRESEIEGMYMRVFACDMEKEIERAFECKFGGLCVCVCVCV